MSASLIWTLQWTLNVFFLAAAALWWWNRRQANEKVNNRVVAYLNVLESKANQMESEADHYRQRFETQLKALLKICDQAQTILERGRIEIAQPPSREEAELRELGKHSPARLSAHSGGTIPTLLQLEKTRERLKTEGLLDLKTVLKDQLA